MRQLAYWLAFVAQFSFQSVHRVISRQGNALVMSRRPMLSLRHFVLAVGVQVLPDVRYGGNDICDCLTVCHLVRTSAGQLR